MRLAYKRVNKNNFSDLVKMYNSLQKDFPPFREPKHSHRNLNRYISNPRFLAFLVYLGSRIIAYQLIDLQFGGKKRARHESMAVKRRYRRKGYGKEIFHYFIKYVRPKGARVIIIRTGSSNNVMKRIFEKSDFKRYKTIKNQRVNGDDTYWYSADNRSNK